MRWLGLVLPLLPLEVFQRGESDPPALAIGRQGQIDLVNAAGRAAGIEPGQTRATALALLPTLILQDRDPQAEHRCLLQLANWALQFTPRVCLQSPPQVNDPHAAKSGVHGTRASATGAASPAYLSSTANTARPAGLRGGGTREVGLLLDIEASLRLFGGLERLQTRISDGVRDLGYAVRVGCAPTPAAAWLAARWQDGLVIRSDARLPIDLARLPIGLLNALEQPRRLDTARAIGLRVLADLIRLPRNGLARRFGTALLHELDQILGQQPDLRPEHEAPTRFDSQLELLADVTATEALLFAMQRQLIELAGWLTARHAGVRGLVIEARHDRLRRQSPRPPTRIEARFASPTRDPQRMLSVVRERLALTPLPAPVHTLHLSCDEIVASGGSANELFPTPLAVEEQLGRLIERLQARLGRDQVQRIHLAADHRPESAYRIAPVEATPPSLTDRSPLLARVPRPLWLLQQPVPLVERNQRPWRSGPLRLVSGPERIEGGWWDDHLIQRDYFIAEDDQSQWLWIYRTRGQTDAGTTGEAGHVHDAVGPSARWFLQGVFG